MREDVREFGARAEAMAADWFLNRGNVKLLAKNFRCKSGEIDLILEESLPEGPELVFVEVKADSLGTWTSGADRVSWEKRRRLRRAMQVFLGQYCGPAESVRFDVLHWAGREWNYYPNVWIEERS